MNPLGVMIDQAIGRRTGEPTLRCAIIALNVARAVAALLPFADCAAKHLRIVNPMTGLA